MTVLRGHMDMGWQKMVLNTCVQSERVTESTKKLSTNLLHTNLDFISVCVWVVECVGEFKKKYICINTVICQGLNGRVRTV